MASKWLPLLLLPVSLMLFLPNSAAAAEKHVKSNSHKQQKRLKINPLTDTDEAWVANIETNVYREGTFENLNLGYSTGNAWDFSISLLNTQIIGPNNVFIADTFFNLSKTFSFNEQVQLVIGSQNGLAFLNTHPQSWYSFSFMDLQYNLLPWLSFHSGPYLANAAITGKVRQVGFVAGTEITLLANTLALQMDYVSGHHALSGGTVNLVYTLLPHFQVYAGVGIPETDSGNQFAGILGFNLSTKNF